MPFVQYMACATTTKGHFIKDGAAFVEVDSCEAKPVLATELAASVPKFSVNGVDSWIPTCICPGSYATVPWDPDTSKWQVLNVRVRAYHSTGHHAR